MASSSSFAIFRVLTATCRHQQALQCSLPMPILQDPIALIGLLAIFFPLIFLLVAAATGLVDLNGGR